MYAIALNDGAHLLHLRKAAEKFLSIALATPSDRNMRPPSLQEIVEADRALWIGVASIQADQGWSLADALAEMIFARPDVYSALAPRLKPHTLPAPPAASGANKRKQPVLQPPPPHKQARPAKAKAKATSKKDAAPKVSLKSWPDSWARTVEGKGPCIRFHTDKCHNKSCRFSHLCPILMGNNTPCGKPHRAADHASVLASRILDDASALLRESPDLDDRFESGKSVSAGLFFRFKPGARKICVSHPSSVRAVNRLIRALAPDHFFSSFVIISGVHSPRHQDSMNACASNVVFPLTSFTGGELRVSKVGDTAGQGPLAAQFVDLPVASGPVSFNARDCPHEVLPSQGLRVVVAAYTLQAALHIDSYPELRASLTALAFPLPPVDFVYSPEALDPRALPLSPGQRALLPSPMAAIGSSAPSDSASTNAHPRDGSSTVDALLGSCHLSSPTPRLFLDLFAGARAPVTSAMQSLRRDCFPPVDLIIDASRDILDDAFFDLLCRIADSGLVGAALAAPVCSKHSILRLRPGGPKPLRDFEHPTGRPDLNWDDSTQLQESALLHDRTRHLLSRVSASGGLIILENPASSLTFHDPLMMSWIESEAPFCAQVASKMSCRNGATSAQTCIEKPVGPPMSEIVEHIFRWGPKPTGSAGGAATVLYPAGMHDPTGIRRKQCTPMREIVAGAQEDLLFIAPGQPLRLRLLKFLLSQLHDSEVSLCDQLESGVSLGVGSALEPSQHWPVRDSEPVIPALHICEGAWQSAESHPDIVQALLEEELQEEWISEYASLEAIQSEFPQVALGRLGLVLAWWIRA
ncbi:unnamed protein product [Symbiodinium microadriaticum]|nr:unnamed protein product [Symbiodinium microadriaticum]